MNIAFFGSSLVSAYWNGAATYYRGIIRALHERGHFVTFYEPDAYERQQHRDMADPEWARVVVYAGEGEAGVNAALEAGAGRGFDREGQRRGRVRCPAGSRRSGHSAAGGLCAFWDVDAPATLSRVHADPADPFRALIPRYDLVLTYGGGQPVMDAYAGVGSARMRPDLQRARPGHAFPCRARRRTLRATWVFWATACPTANTASSSFFLMRRRAGAGQAVSAGRQRLGRQGDAGQMCAMSATSTRPITTRSTARRAWC